MVTFANDDAAAVATLESWGDTITSTPWWTAVTGEYCLQPAMTPCIGSGSGGGHVHLPAANASYTVNVGQPDNDELKALVQAQVASGVFPAPTPDTLYSLQFPTGTTISPAAYHDEVIVTPPGGDPTRVAFSVVAEHAVRTRGASHELIEAATDPFWKSAPGYQMMDPGFAAWLGFEATDFCVDWPGYPNGAPLDVVSQSGFMVPRSWSNTAALGSHDPCVPAPSGSVYFNTAPEAQMVRLRAGETKALTVTGFSDAPMGSWNIRAYARIGNSISATFDKASLSNGDTATLSVTRNSGQVGGSLGLLVIESTAGNQLHVWLLEVEDRNNGISTGSGYHERGGRCGKDTGRSSCVARSWLWGRSAAVGATPSTAASIRVVRGWIRVARQPTAVDRRLRAAKGRVGSPRH
jgi:hypothetical protein